MKKIPVFILSFLALTPVVFAYPPSTQINFILEVTDGKGNTISDATCSGYIWNNDLTTINQTLPLTYSPQSQVYHAPFITPDTAGQYLQTANCTLANGKKVYDKKTFSVEGLPSLEEKLISINNTIKDQTNYWGNTLYNQTNWWGNYIYNTLLNMTFGGNLTLNVDYDRIATYTLAYLRASKFWCWFLPCPRAGELP